MWLPSSPDLPCATLCLGCTWFRYVHIEVFCFASFRFFIRNFLLNMTLRSAALCLTGRPMYSPCEFFPGVLISSVRNTTCQFVHASLFYQNVSPIDQEPVFFFLYYHCMLSICNSCSHIVGLIIFTNETVFRSEKKSWPTMKVEADPGGSWITPG